MLNKKGFDYKATLLFLITSGIMLIIIVYLYSSVSSSTSTLFAHQNNQKLNESVTIVAVADGSTTNSTILSQAGFISATDSVVNGTAPFSVLTRNVDYKITQTGLSGNLDNKANFTLLNSTGKGYNNSALFVTYQFNTASQAETQATNVTNSNFSALALTAIILTLTAAGIILGILFSFGR